MAQKRAQRRFTREYKAQAVQRLIESGRPLVLSGLAPNRATGTRLARDWHKIFWR